MNLSKSKQKTGAAWRSLVVTGSLLMSIACAGAATESGGTDTSSDSTGSSVFPSDLAVASPLSVSTDEASLALVGSARMTTSSSYVTRYAASTLRINRILNGTSSASCVFDPALFFAEEQDADCYGPSIDYVDHPDASGGEPSSGELPPHDVGIWEETDVATGHACTAAELNARMEGISNKGEASLTSIASMVCVLDTNGVTVAEGDTYDSTALMTALGIADVTFNSATVTHVAADEYSYELAFTYDDGTDTHDIVVSLEHAAGAAPTAQYSGQVSYLVNDTQAGGNCPGDVTYNGSLQYVRDGIDDLKAQVRSAFFCGHDADGRDVNGLIDPTNKYDGSNPNGWSDNFSIFTANYDPTTLAGSYTYVWQAGPNDSNSRAFNVKAEEISLAAASVATAQAFFGYGEDIATTDGSIGGFICNWAGPGNSHDLGDVAQYQAVAFDSTSGVFASAASNIEYAPTVSCEYDGTGSFVYDTDGDGDLTDETGAAVAQDLYPAVDVDLDGDATMTETIEAAGFTLPTI